MPGVSGNNASVRYAPNGGVKLERDANGNIINYRDRRRGQQHHQLGGGGGGEQRETSFAAKNTYSPHDEDGLIDDVVKGADQCRPGRREYLRQRGLPDHHGELPAQ